MSEAGPNPGTDASPIASDNGAESIGGEFILPGGKVDGEAIRRAYVEAREDGDDEFVAKVRFTLARDLKDRLDKYLTSRIKFMSRSKLQELIDQGGATVNGSQAKSSTKLRVGDTIEIVLPPPASGELEPDDIPLDVLYEDEHIMVINKHADIIVHPARMENRGTMLNALIHYFQTTKSGELSSVGEDFARPGVVHRLDRHTSGCIVFAKSDLAHWKMGSKFEQRQVDKRYLAIVQGWVSKDEQLIDLPLGPHPSRVRGSREKRVVRFDDLGKPSQTICRVRERYELPPLSSKGEPRRYSLVELELLTGRTHQIRVHLAHIGHPIAGDDMYTGKPMLDDRGEQVLDKPALHAALLAFDHPMSGEPLAFVAPVRDDVRACIDLLRLHGSPKLVFVEGTVPMERLGLS
ncbi:MAG: RluA family pseudouridine synthase [Phycisphaerales bacterium]|nr:RluA family pseudouridine synthase [Phycisphaerales bacterium]